MPRPSKRSLLKLATIGLSFVWLAVWTVDLTMHPGSLPSRYMVLGAGFIGMVTLGMACLRTTTHEERQTARFLDALSRLAPHELADASGSAPILPASHPLYETAARFRAAYAAWAMRLQQAEHSRAAIEVKARRSGARLEQLEAILAGLSDPVIVVDGYDELLLANPSAERLLGLKDKSQVEQRVLSRLSRCEKLLDLLNDVRRRKSSTLRTSELELTDAHGQSHCYSVSARAVALGGESAADGVKQCAVAVLRDVGNVKAIQKRNAEFVSAVSHEMKTPLAGIKAYVELLVDGDAEDEKTREEFLGVINGQANRLQRLIDNLLNIARIEAGVVSVQKEQRSLNELLEEALRIVQPSAEPKRIALTSELSNLYLSVRVDRDMMMQVAINLLSNAVKYTPDGGHVVLRSRLSGDQVQFDVLDNGVGLSAEDCQKVFEKFYRVKKDREMAQGTGLGLALAKHIVEDVHGGTLTVASQLGEGSTFTVTLPCAGQLN